LRSLTAASSRANLEAQVVKRLSPRTSSRRPSEAQPSPVMQTC
jgi:hypothetical protein